MKKMMFNDRYRLTEAVIEKRKTVTRRLVKPIIDGVDQVGWKNCDYKVGEIVAVAQSYRNAGYKEDQIFYRSIPEINGYAKQTAASQTGWKNKMFVSADLMPHQIRILDVRVKRLQDITEEDCLREGISVGREPMGAGRFFCYFDDNKNGGRTSYDYPLEAYACLIDKISGKETWDNNPYVWRIEFELIK